jgi:hypothetical protein
MKEFDYYSVMEPRIKYLAKKYDPNNRFPVEWEKKREIQDFSSLIKPEPEKHEKKRISKVYNSVIAFLF